MMLSPPPPCCVLLCNKAAKKLKEQQSPHAGYLSHMPHPMFPDLRTPTHLVCICV